MSKEISKASKLPAKHRPGSLGTGVGCDKGESPPPCLHVLGRRVQRSKGVGSLGDRELNRVRGGSKGDQGAGIRAG